MSPKLNPSWRAITGNANDLERFSPARWVAIGQALNLL